MVPSGKADGGLPIGIFYHPSFSRSSYLTQGSRLMDFPDALKPLLKDPAFRLFESPPVDDDLILKVHSEELLMGVRIDQLCATAWHSVGGAVLAAEKIAKGEIQSAFVFIGAGGHHSGRNFFGGYCCFNDMVIAMHVLREQYRLNRFAVLDTDAHHGDGTRDLTKHDSNVLHVCLCSTEYESPDGTKVDVNAPGRSWFSFASPRTHDLDKKYAEAAEQAFATRARKFKPDIIFWYFGFDTHHGDYGDIGLSIDAYLPTAKMMRNLATELCDGRLVVILGGGSRSDIAANVIPPIIKTLRG